MTHDLSISLQTELVRILARSSLFSPSSSSNSANFSGGSIHLFADSNGYWLTKIASIDLPKEPSSPIYNLLLKRKSAKRAASVSFMRLADAMSTYGFVLYEAR